LALRAAAETRRRACGGGRPAAPGSLACRACVPSAPRRSDRHGAGPMRSRHFAAPSATGGTPASPRRDRASSVQLRCHGLLPSPSAPFAHRRIAAPKRAARRERAFAAGRSGSCSTPQRANSGSRSASKSRSNESCSRSRGSAIRCGAQSAERQIRIDRLQRRVQQLQAQNRRNRQAQRRATGSTKPTPARATSARSADLAQQQKLGVAPARRNGPRSQPRAARGGRFAARFRNNADPRAQGALAARLKRLGRRAMPGATTCNAASLARPCSGHSVIRYLDLHVLPEAYDDAYWPTPTTI